MNADETDNSANDDVDGDNGDKHNVTRLLLLLLRRVSVSMIVSMMLSLLMYGCC